MLAFVSGLKVLFLDETPWALSKLASLLPQPCLIPWECAEETDTKDEYKG